MCKRSSFTVLRGGDCIYASFFKYFLSRFILRDFPSTWNAVNELPRSRAARYQKEFLLTPMQSIEEFFWLNNLANRGSNTRQTGPRNLGQVVKFVVPWHLSVLFLDALHLRWVVYYCKMFPGITSYEIFSRRLGCQKFTSSIPGCWERNANQ